MSDERHVHDAAANITYEPWTDGHAIGFKLTHHNEGTTSYIYLNPSGDSDGGTPDVFVYQGVTGDPAQDAALHYYPTAWADVNVHFVQEGMTDLIREVYDDPS